MKKSRLLLLDANVVLEVSRCRLWASLAEKYEVFLSAVVAEEAQFFVDDTGRKYIDLNELVESGRITILDAPISEVKAFRDQFGPDYFARIDPGEAESLTILLRDETGYRICSSDAIVFKVLGNLGNPELSISLEKAPRLAVHGGVQAEVPQGRLHRSDSGKGPHQIIAMCTRDSTTSGV